MKLFLCFLFLLTSCSFGKKSTRQITIESNPKDADVSYFSPHSKTFKELGKTPLIIPEDQVKEWMSSNNEYVVIRVAKSGHMVENLFVDLRNNYRLDYIASLQPVDVWNNKEMEVSSTSANRLAVKVQAINHQVFNKNFDKALKDTEVLIDQFPKAHVFYDIKGSILVLMGKNAQAVTSYQKSLALNPDNNEAKKMLEKLKGDRL